MIQINGRRRIPDGITRRVVSEVKNVKEFGFTKQLRDYADWAQQEGKAFDLYIRYIQSEYLKWN